MLIEKFLRKEKISVDVVDFSARHISTGMVGAYIRKLYDEEGFSHMGYRFEKKKGLGRFVIYALPDSVEIIQYFKDRCPAMVEKECMELKGTAHKWNTWANGFKEISNVDYN